MEPVCPDWTEDGYTEAQATQARHYICRYAEDFVIIVKGTKADALSIRKGCRSVLEDMPLPLTLV